MSNPHVRQLLDLIKEQNKAIEKLIAERDSQRQEISALVGWIQEDRDALMCLQQIYNSPTADDNSRIQAARAAINFERSKPPSQTNVSFSLFDFLEKKRLEAEAAKTIEHRSKLEPTVLGGEGPTEPAA